MSPRLHGGVVNTSSEQAVGNCPVLDRKAEPELLPGASSRTGGTGCTARVFPNGSAPGAVSPSAVARRLTLRTVAASTSKSSIACSPSASDGEGRRLLDCGRSGSIHPWAAGRYEQHQGDDRRTPSKRPEAARVPSVSFKPSSMAVKLRRRRGPSTRKMRRRPLVRKLALPPSVTRQLFEGQIRSARTIAQTTP